MSQKFQYFSEEKKIQNRIIPILEGENQKPATERNIISSLLCCTRIRLASAVRPSLSRGESQCKFHYFHLFFNFSFSLLVVPFRPVFQDGHYKISTNKVQKAVCFLSWGMVAFRRLTIMRGTWQGTFNHPTLFYFYLAHSHMHTILTGIFFWTLYSNADKFERMLEKISHSCLFTKSSYKRNKTWALIIGLHISFAFMGFISAVVGYDVIDSWNWTPSWLFRSYVARARYAFFVDTNITHCSIRPEWAEIGSLDAVLASLVILISGVHELHMYLMSLLFGLCIITLWTATDSFTKIINSLEGKDRDKHAIVLYLYQELKEFSDILNKIWGTFCFWYIIDIIPYLATDLDFGFRANDWFDAMKMFRSVLFFSLNIILSGETFRKLAIFGVNKMYWFSFWLLNRENRGVFTGQEQELKLLLQELRLEPIGMGVSGFYQVNYGFAAHVCAIIITFFIITLQYADLKGHP